MNRCARCGRFTKEPHRHVTEVPFNLVTSESESRRLLGSATIPDSQGSCPCANCGVTHCAPGEHEEAWRSNSHVYCECGMQLGTIPDSNLEIGELKIKVESSPVRRRWPWRKRR